MDVNKAYEFEIVKGEAKYKGLDIARLQAGQILHSICMDKTGKKLFNNIDEIYELIATNENKQKNSKNAKEIERLQKEILKMWGERKNTII